ncbi:MAG: EF-hand domain-containing protein [Betaproteobacteria bacterium]|nr:EF-hand domain-containing protein [Betaproteobacteria bacterium]
MRLTQSLFFIVAAALALAVGASYAADEHIGKDKTKGDPGFNALDKNNDGYLSRTEAAKNPTLAKKFKQVDKNGDGKISRMEYLEAMTAQDASHAKDKTEDTASSAKNKVEGMMHKDKDQPASSGSTTSK